MIKNQNKTLILKNKYIQPLNLWLFKLALHGNQSRQRTRFIASLYEKMNEIDTVKEKTLQIYADKDDAGKPKILTNDKGESEYYLTPENKGKYIKEYGDFLERELPYPLDTKERKEMAYIVREILLSTQQEFQGPQAIQYNEWCEIFEKI